MVIYPNLSNSSFWRLSIESNGLLLVPGSEVPLWAKIIEILMKTLHSTLLINYLGHYCLLVC